ncbi:hypothetical protein [Escherichia coli]|uniref:hypothetical protein n=1 Tax=Escherichia coli TaxID=562 RepID=UPI0029C20543|nr:hypothetical protein [Escherichia coli]MDX5558875.1 hypothetical protein [Escherichia coli]
MNIDVFCFFLLVMQKWRILFLLIKWIFILFNIFMIYTLLVGLGGTSEIINNATSDAEKAGAVIGTGLGLITIGSLWVIGDIIIGILVFLTKPKG